MPDAAAPTVAQLVAYARQVHPTLDRINYYQLLRLSQSADASAIRAAYYKIAALLHPDRYHNLSERAVREMLETIYARINEGYRVLSSPEKRVAYDKGLAQGKLRYDFNERAPQGPKNPEDTVTNEQAKKFFRLGMVCMGKKDWKGAAMNFNFAKMMEPQNAAINDKLAEAQAALKGAPK
jgi:curved DNA-binding protein CbpA